MDPALRIKLTGRAWRYLLMLEDLGHLDPDLVDDLLVNLSERGSARRTVTLDVASARRAAAIELFDEARVTGDDWNLLFS